MQLIYIHGLEADHMSLKGEWLTQWCAAHRPEITVQRPNLNLPPQEVMQVLTGLIDRDTQTGLVGSSLGGFYATQCVAQRGVRAVLVNPSVRPFESMQRFFGAGQSSHQTSTGWRITPEQLETLHQMYQPIPVHAEQMLVMLKTGDEVIDYRIARDYYSQAGAQSSMLIELGGDHFMHDMPRRIPLMVDFLFGLESAGPGHPAESFG